MLNLDTHILVFALQGQLSAREKLLLAGNQWGISAIVIWEISKLVQLGRLDINIDSPEFAQSLAPVHVWPIDLAVCRSIRQLDFRSDPADEIIAATSIVHNAPLLTRDTLIRKSRLVPFAS